MNKLVMQYNWENDVELLVDKTEIIIENTIRKINCEVILMYYELGNMISEYKKKNSKYGGQVVNKFSRNLTLKYGKGFDRRNLYYAIKFYNLFSTIMIEIEFNEKVKPASLSH